jgi:peptide/nickel transport system permease protein
VLITVLAIVPYSVNFNLGWDWFPYLPAGSTYTTNPVSQENNPFSHLYHAILPAMTLAIPQIAIISKYVRTSMLEVLGLDYIRTAWAKGLPAWRVLGKHAFRNALLPTITVIGLALPAIASGSIVIEYAFAYQGLGYLTFRAIGGCIPTPDMMCPGSPIDHAMLMALLVLLVAVVSLANMLADIMYMVADPRVEYAGAGGERKARGE